MAYTRIRIAVRNPVRSTSVKPRSGSEDTLRCSFCHKSQDAVAKLISSPSDYPRAYICDECVAVCNSILEDDRGDTHAAAAPDHLPKPAEVKAFRVRCMCELAPAPNSWGHALAEGCRLLFTDPAFFMTKLKYKARQALRHAPASTIAWS